MATKLRHGDVAVNYYGVLGINSNARRVEIAKAYKQAALRYHPDRETGSNAEMAVVNRAWEVLSSASCRAEYDLMRSRYVTRDSLERGRTPTRPYAPPIRPVRPRPTHTTRWLYKGLGGVPYLPWTWLAMMAAIMGPYIVKSIVEIGLLFTVGQVSPRLDALLWLGVLLGMMSGAPTVWLFDAYKGWRRSQQLHPNQTGSFWALH